MNEEKIKLWIQSDQVRRREIDKERIKSMIKSAQTTSIIAKSIKLNEDSATTVYREIYEAIRQLGDAKLWSIGLEPRNHEVSMEALKSMNIKHKIMLNHLSRYKSLRHDINYRGFRSSISQSEEILEFWEKCSKDIIQNIKI